MCFFFVVVRVEKEYVLVRRQLSSEVDSKKTVIGNLSKELEIHQKNFNELKDELNKVGLMFNLGFYSCGG